MPWLDIRQLHSAQPTLHFHIYTRERDESVVLNATYEFQLNTLTTQVTQLQSIGRNADTASGKEFEAMCTQIATLTLDNAVLKGLLVTWKVWKIVHCNIATVTVTLVELRRYKTT